MFDFEICTAPQGWVFADVLPMHIEEAKERFLERQKRCRAQGVREKVSPDDMDDDHQWSGDLGEMLVKDYLELRAIDHNWLTGVRESEFDPDFRITRVNIDVKTKRRKVMPKNQPDYYETVSHDQFVLAEKREVIGFMFCDYAYKEQRIYLIGKMSYKQFDQLKEWRAKGAMLDKCKISADSWDVPITKVIPPLKWRKAA